MGFTVVCYPDLSGLVNLQNLYVSINGSFSLQKKSTIDSYPSAFPLPFYVISYKVSISSSKSQGPLKEENQSYNLQSIPAENTIFQLIYDNIKLNLDPNYNSSQQTLIFNDDI